MPLGDRKGLKQRRAAVQADMDEAERQRVLCAVRNLKRRAVDLSASVERDKRDLFRCVADLCRQFDKRPVEAVIDLTADEDDDNDDKRAVIQVAATAPSVDDDPPRHDADARYRPADVSDDRPLVRRRRRGRRHRDPTSPPAPPLPVPTVPETMSVTLCDWSAIRACLDDAISSTPPKPLAPPLAAPNPGDGHGVRASHGAAMPAVQPVRKRSKTHRPPATVGDRVFVKIDGRRTVGLVLGFDGLSYRLAVPRTEGGGGGSTPWQQHALVLPASGSAADAADMRARVLGTMGWCGAAERWRNAALPECVVCLDAVADAVLGCRCTVPAVCATCAVSVARCPHCDARPRSEVHDPGARVAHDLVEVDPSSPWVRVPLRVLDGDARPLTVRAQVDWPGALLVAVICEVVGRPPRDVRLLVGGRAIVDDRPLAAQGIADDRLVCVMPRLRGD